jgi:hypothetical protein
MFKVSYLFQINFNGLEVFPLTPFQYLNIPKVLALNKLIKKKNDQESFVKLVVFKSHIFFKLGFFF